MAPAAPGVGITQPRFAAEQRRDLIEIEAHGRVSGCTVKDAVMLEPRRNHENVVELHVERPMGHALLGGQQHSDDQLVVAGGALRAHANVEGADAKGEITDADMGQTPAQPPTPNLHDVDMGAMDGLVKSLETVKLPRINQKKLPHRFSLLPKRDNSAAARGEIPPQREAGAST